METITNVKERPILFSTPMVRAILEGRKTVTRRALRDKLIINQDPDRYRLHGHKNMEGHAFFEDLRPEITPWISPIPCPYGFEGDVLWVRETWAYVDFAGEDNGYVYRATDPDWETMEGWKWKPSIFMPRAACRLRLEIQSISVERLQDITEEDAIREGIVEYEDGTYHNYFKRKGLRYEDGVECLLAKGSFQSIWISINGAESWNANPWIWKIEFKKI